MSVERLLPGRRRKEGPPAILEEYLDVLEAQRRALIIELVAVEEVLVKHGRLKKGTVPAKEKVK